VAEVVELARVEKWNGENLRQVEKNAIAQLNISHLEHEGDEESNREHKFLVGGSSDVTKHLNDLFDIFTPVDNPKQVEDQLARKILCIKWFHVFAESFPEIVNLLMRADLVKVGESQLASVDTQIWQNTLEILLQNDSAIDIDACASDVKLLLELSEALLRRVLVVPLAEQQWWCLLKLEALFLGRLDKIHVQVARQVIENLNVVLPQTALLVVPDKDE
jgi:hypothetical protein